METPFELTGEWTSSENEASFLDSLVEHGARVETLGTSVSGLPVRSVSVGNPNAENVCLYISTQHGTEPAPRENAMAVARDLATTTDSVMLNYLESTQWVIVPTMNVDRVLKSRTNANSVDLNRDWQALEQPETQAVITLFGLDPVLVIDGHEYGNTPTGESDVACNIPNNSGVNPGVVGLSETLRGVVSDAVIANGSSYAHYESSVTPTVLRNTSGLNHATTLLVETWQNERNSPNVDVPTRPPGLRVEDHRIAFYAALNHHRLNAALYREVSDNSRNPFPGGSGPDNKLPWLDMWNTPRASLGGKPVVDAYFQASTVKKRVYSQLGELLA